MKIRDLIFIIVGVACSGVVATGALAEKFNIPGGDLDAALDAYSAQSGIVVAISNDAVRGVHTNGVRGDLSAEAALARVLQGTGFVAKRDPSGVLGVVRSSSTSYLTPENMHTAATAAPTVSGAALETVTVTSSKIGGDVQNIPISITAMSQEQLTATQTTGGPDLVKQVPNLTFTKTNFTGYSIQIRGIGTQAISVTTDPAVAVAFNDIPFIRNHFFEQEFYDVAQVQVLRGPQGTLYGRNATAGVVNLTSAKPTDQFEAMASVDIGNYGNRRLEGMINVPIINDQLDVRVAGEWTKRQGYSFNDLTDQRIDGRDLWSGRVTIGLKPIEGLQTYLVWEHFSEDDDRMRTAKQLCETDPIPTKVDGTPVTLGFATFGAVGGYLSQGCQQTSLYAPTAFQVPNGLALPYYNAFTGGLTEPIKAGFDPYASTTQSHNLRVIESTLNPVYGAKNDTIELNTDYDITPSLSLTSQTSYSHDFLWSTEDYNRFNTQPGIFDYAPDGNPGLFGTLVSPSGVFCDPQLGCSNRLVAQDLSSEHAWQLGQEFRLSSHTNGPLNFSIGGNYLHYETTEDYYVFINTLTMYSASGNAERSTYIPGVTDDTNCLVGGPQFGDPKRQYNVIYPCVYIDPNPISKLNGNGHNYFRSENPYVLNSYAGFGEVYYDVLKDIKLTTGLRFTEDRKHFSLMPSWLVIGDSWGYPVTGVVNQQWDQFTGRFAANWTPTLTFTDQTLFYGSYAHGYKAGGANPPGAVFLTYQADLGDITNPIHPLTFKPEFIDAFELGSKNTLLDGSLTLNASAFYYNYENYQISEIVDRTSINLNFDAHVVGAELESTWEPVPGLRFNFAGGWERTRMAQGAHAVDLMDRTAGQTDWMVVKPFVTQASNCILPKYVVLAMIEGGGGEGISFACGESYILHNDPLTRFPYVQNPSVLNGGGVQVIPPGYPGYDPLSVDPSAPAGVNNGLGLPPNNGQGFDKDLSGNELPNAPPFTVSGGAQYTIPLSADWAGTLRGDYYWQDYSWARVFNDKPYDRLRGYTNLNLALILTSQSGWQVMFYDKNVFDTTAITGAFLNSDDSGLTTNVFLTDPKLIGIRVTKNW